MTRQEVTLTVLNEVKSVKRLLHCPFWLFCTLCECSSSIQDSRADPLFLCYPAICGANINMHVACSFSLVAASDLTPKNGKISFISSVFHYTFLNDSAPVNCVCSFGYT